MKLYTFWRSSAAYRVRIALNLKGLPHDLESVHLRREGGQHRKPDYLAMNPQALVPTLEDDGRFIGQSMAIIEYLEEAYPEPALLPGDAYARAQIRSMAQVAACEMHPLNNLRVLNYLKDSFGLSAEQVDGQWYRHWIKAGFDGLEEMLARNEGGGRYCWGDTPTLADVFLVPQVYNARRFACPMDAYPTIVRIDAALNELDAFAKALPEAQTDAE